MPIEPHVCWINEGEDGTATWAAHASDEGGPDVMVPTPGLSCRVNQLAVGWRCHAVSFLSYEI